MKISKKVGLIIGIVILVAALAGLYTVYSRQAGELRDLNDRLLRAQTLLPGLTHNKQNLQNELAQATSSLEVSKAQFPKVVESIEYGEDFFKVAYGENLYTMAAGCGVKLTKLTVSPPTAKTVGAITYSVCPFVVVVEGEVNNIFKFIDAIGTSIDYQLQWSFQLPWSVNVKSVNIDVSKSVATIKLDVYGYKGT